MPPGDIIAPGPQDSPENWQLLTHSTDKDTEALRGKTLAQGERHVAMSCTVDDKLQEWEWAMPGGQNVSCPDPAWQGL